MSETKKMIYLTSKLARRFSWSKEPIESDAVFGLYKLPLASDGRPLETRKRLLFLSKSLTAACKAGNL